MTAHVPRLFIDQRLSVGSDVILKDKAAHHIQHVLRGKSGDSLILFDGSGGEYASVVIEIRRNQVELGIISFDAVNRESKLQIMLGIGMLKRDGMKTALQKATELGVTGITPIESGYTSVSRQQFEKRRVNCLQVIQSACEQSGRTMLPVLEKVQSFDQWLELSNADLKLLASPDTGSGLGRIESRPRSVCVLVGPEGGISDTEEEKALAAGFLRISMGSRILRAETVPTALLALLQYRWGDF
jgi:16S rRNA (uracil1498-N3)-methyltransferase